MDYEALFEKYREGSLSGRYITLRHIEPLLRKQQIGLLDENGLSVENRPIYSLLIGEGAIKILLWSQMHGNESTATKALFDFLNLLESGSAQANHFLAGFTFCIVPMLNPDGAEKYTRINAAGIDLNRDFVTFSQPESTCLAELFSQFKPDYCFNLHDQRTIFGAGDSGNPATISFLAPAYNEAREWNEPRLKAVAAILGMNAVLQQLIPGNIGRFDDSFNLNCAGDKFQWEGAATILIEAGHFRGDYEREVTRKYFFIALLSAFDTIAANDIVGADIAEYLNIPQNKVVFYDFVYKNIRINYDGMDLITNFACQYEERLVDGKIIFKPFISAVGNLKGSFGHCEQDAEGAEFYDGLNNNPTIGNPADFKIGDRQYKDGLPI